MLLRHKGVTILLGTDLGAECIVHGISENYESDYSSGR
jgi:hypothetical protein